MTDEKVLTPDLKARPGTMGLHTARAVERLKKGKPDELIGLDEMADVVGRLCGNHEQGRGNVTSAIKHVETNFGLIWHWDRDAKGWRCLTNSAGAHLASQGSRATTNRRARRDLVRAACINQGDLKEDERREFEHGMVAVGLVLTASGAAFGKRLKAIEGKLHEPDPSALLRLMSRDA